MTIYETELRDIMAADFYRALINRAIAMTAIDAMDFAGLATVALDVADAFMVAREGTEGDPDAPGTAHQFVLDRNHSLTTTRSTAKSWPIPSIS